MIAPPRTAQPTVVMPGSGSSRSGFPLVTSAVIGFAIAVVVSQALNQPSYPLAPWLSGLAFGSFALALHNRALIIVPILLSELTLYNYFAPTLGMAQRFGITLVALLLTAGLIARAQFLGDHRLLRVLLPAVLLVVTATWMNTVFSEDAFVFQYMRYQIGQVFVLVIIAALIRSRTDLKYLAVAAVVIGTVAGLATIWQHYAPTSAPYGAATADTVRNWKGRAVGFANTPIGISDQMTFVLAPLLGVLLNGPWRLDRRRVFLGTALLIMFAGLNFTYTRSALFAFGPGMVAMGFLLRGYRRWLILGAAVVGILVFPMLENTGLIGDRYFRDASDDQSARSHEALWAVSLAIALDNPVFGIGNEHFEEVALDYMGQLSFSNENVSASDAEGQRPHNDWLAAWVSWGIVALIAYVALFLGALTNFLAASRHTDPLVRGLAIGGVGGLVVYGVNSAYHNLLDSSMFLFLLAGLSVALVRMMANSTEDNTAGPRVSMSWIGRVR